MNDVIEIALREKKRKEKKERIISGRRNNQKNKSDREYKNLQGRGTKRKPHRI